MIQTLAHTALFFAGAFITIVLVGAVLLPLFYLLPRTVIWVGRGWVRWQALARPVALIGAWVVGIAVITSAFAKFLPTLYAYIDSDPGWNFGQSVGIMLSFFRVVAKDGRRDLRGDFLRETTRYLTPAGAAVSARLEAA
jgi:hypothetical protein